MNPIIYTSPMSAHHDTGVGHPENSKRLEALQSVFDSAPFKDWEQKKSTPATLEQIMLAHDEGYIFDLQDKTPDHGLVHLDNDTVLSPHSYEAALHAAGAVCQAVDDIMSAPPSSSPRAFCAVRPPGHHAEPDKAMGFCIFNNIFIGARHAQEAHNLKKIAIIDFDVHHGNGTEVMARTHNKTHPDQPILYISSHGHPLFPMTGDPAQNNENILNLHLPEDCNSKQFKTLYENHVFSALNAFKPDLIMISAGFDAHIDDPLANSNLNTQDYAWVTQKLCEISKNHAKNRIISVLEGGYEPETLKKCVTVHLQELSL